MKFEGEMMITENKNNNNYDLLIRLEEGESNGVSSGQYITH